MFGWVSVDTDRDTATFAVSTIRRRWRVMGKKRYPKTKWLMITADGGGSNGYRVRLWKVELQKLAGELKLPITVCHLPPGTSYLTPMRQFPGHSGARKDLAGGSRLAALFWVASPTTRPCAQRSFRSKLGARRRNAPHVRFGRRLMTSSKTIAGLMGPTLIAIAAALLVNLGSIPALVEPVAHDPALVVVSGVLSFVAGLAVVRVHNHWAADWTVLVTILGWLLLIGGLVRMLFPLWLAGMAASLGRSTGMIAGEAVVLLVIGLYLSYNAYMTS
jgi:hypothetical protein